MSMNVMTLEKQPIPAALETLIGPRACSLDEWETLTQITREMPVEWIADLLRASLFSLCHRSHYLARSVGPAMPPTVVAIQAAKSMNTALAGMDLLHSADQVDAYLANLESGEVRRAV